MKNKEIYRNEIKSYIIRAGMTMSEAVEILADEYGWSSSVHNLSDKLKRGSLRYGEAVELADVLGYGYCLAKASRIEFILFSLSLGFMLFHIVGKGEIHCERKKSYLFCLLLLCPRRFFDTIIMD